MSPTKEDQQLLDNAIDCCLCKKKFTSYDEQYGRWTIRHHNHLTGAFNKCNLNCKQAKITPVLFHNLRNFDAHILFLNLGEFNKYRFNCIARNAERYVSFSLGGILFLDSFLPSILNSLIDNLAQDGLDAFPHLLYELESRDDAKLFLRKDVYPYEYMDSSINSMTQTSPRRKCFILLHNANIYQKKIMI